MKTVREQMVEAAQNWNLPRLQALPQTEDLRTVNDQGSLIHHMLTRTGGAGTEEADFAQMLRYLVEQGVDINAQNSARQTALHFAIWIRQPFRLRLLMEHGADPTIPDENGNSVLDDLRFRPKTAISEEWRDQLYGMICAFQARDAMSRMTQALAQGKNSAGPGG